MERASGTYMKPKVEEAETKNPRQRDPKVMGFLMVQLIAEERVGLDKLGKGGEGFLYFDFFQIERA